jgi:uncharacterized protein (TIGR04255 family)
MNMQYVNGTEVLMALDFSSFQKTRLLFEARFPESFIISDVLGTICDQLSARFKSLKSLQNIQNILQNESLYSADNRFAISISSTKLSITDFKPAASWDESFEAVREIFLVVSEFSRLRVFNRIGTRFQYSVSCKDRKTLRSRVGEFAGIALPKKSIFRIEPISSVASYKFEADDGDLGYIVQLYPEEEKLEYSLPIGATVDIPAKETFALMFDVDFFTVRPVSLESFDIMTWLRGWQRTLNQDADTFLKMGQSLHGRRD